MHKKNFVREHFSREIFTRTCELAGFGSVEKQPAQYREYFTDNPYRPGEGLPGTVFHIGRPLLFYEVRGDALFDYARDAEAREITAAMREQSLIAYPIESYGERIGAVIISQSDPRRNFDAEDLEFAQAVAERIGAASHIHRLTRIAQDGTCWCGPTVWRGRAAMRISVSSWATTAEDVERSVAAISRAAGLNQAAS